MPKASATDLTLSPAMPAQGNAKAAAKAVAVGSRDVWMVPPDSLVVLPGFNVRAEEDPEYQAHVRFIADSIKENGYDNSKPIAGFASRGENGDFIAVTDGHTRLKAVKLAIAEGAAIEAVPVVLKPQGTSVEDLTVGLFTANQGRPLSMLEASTVVKRLVGFNMEPADIARRIGKSTTHVNDLLLLAGAEPAVRKMVATGQVSGSLAIDTVKAHGAKASSVLGKAVDEALAGGKSKATGKNVKTQAGGGTAALKEIFTVKRTGDGTLVLSSVQIVALERILAGAVTWDEPKPEDIEALKPVLGSLSKYLGTEGGRKAEF